MYIIQMNNTTEVHSTGEGAKIKIKLKLGKIAVMSGFMTIPIVFIRGVSNENGRLKWLKPLSDLD